MADDDLIMAVHTVTKIVQEIPRTYLALFPDFRELNDADLIERRRGQERKIFGEHLTAAPISPASVVEAPITEDNPITEEPLAEDQPAEAPVLEGGN